MSRLGGEHERGGQPKSWGYRRVHGRRNKGGAHEAYRRKTGKFFFITAVVVVILLAAYFTA